MTTSRGEGDGQARIPPRRVPAAVLAERIAATLAHHEPGWRLPRLTALARRYNATPAEVDAAIDQLAARHLLRRLPDGQIYRASPAEYLVPLAGLAGLAYRVDPMGAELTCLRRQVSARRAPEDIGRALGLEPGGTVVVIRCLWEVSGEPGALSAAYLPERLAGEAGDFTGFPFGNEEAGASGEPQRLRAVFPPAAGAGLPRAVQVELAPPPPSVARSLRLAAGQAVAMVTMRFEEQTGPAPVALTTAMLRPDLFRIVVEAPEASFAAASGDGSPGAWTHAAEGWEP